MRLRKLMTQSRRFARIVILSLLSVSVCLPIFFYSGTLLFDVSKDYIEDLTTINYGVDALEVTSVEQEYGKGLKEPAHLVYKQIDVNLGVSNSSSNSSVHSVRSEDSIVNTSSLKVNGTNHHASQHYSFKSHEEEKNRTSGGKGQNKQTVFQYKKRSQSQPQRILDEKVKEMRDQVIRAKAYLNFSPPNSNSHFAKELRQRMKEVERAMGDSDKDSDIPKSALQKMKALEPMLAKASRMYPHCSAMVQKLRAMTNNAEEQVKAHINQAAFLTQLAGRTTPKGLHCLSMRLTSEYFALDSKERELANQYKLRDPELYHIVVFSDNILACAVVVNSTISVAREPEKMVFHIITDVLTLPAISMWFLSNPPGEAAIQIQSIDNFERLFSKYSEIQIQSIDNFERLFSKYLVSVPRDESADPIYSSALNHLRFYLPDLLPSLNKIVLLDHDVVVQKDLKRLWSVDMKGKVNGAVETCGEGEPSVHRMDKLLNFSDPLIARKFDPIACGWKFGMNLFDLKEWSRRNLTRIYDKYLKLGTRRPLWRGDSLPLGWVTFYNQTVALNRRWHVDGLGEDTAIPSGDVEKAAVLHYSGILKPWLDIGLEKYKNHWKKYVNYDHPFLHQCNIQQ